MNITVKDVPPDLHQRLRNAAQCSGRSLNKLILYTLERSVYPTQIDRGNLLHRIQQRRDRLGTWLEDEALRSAIQDGRR